MNRHRLCGFDLNLTYPQTGGAFPTLNMTSGLRATLLNSNNSESDISLSARKELVARMLHTKTKRFMLDKHQEAKRTQRKRDLTERANGTLDPWYQCDIWEEMADYALNFSIPWSAYPFFTFL